ncbi:hypothetical protein G6F56_013484 [Rhizopus delemar]|nr:hypothetical protein G6F56_013484 [Rhizopus delemar]
MSTTLVRCECPDICAKKINQHDLLSRNAFASHEDKRIEVYGNIRVSATHGQRVYFPVPEEVQNLFPGPSVPEEDFMDLDSPEIDLADLLVDEDTRPASPVQDFLSDSDEESVDEGRGQFFFCFFFVCFIFETGLIGKYV